MQERGCWDSSGIPWCKVLVSCSHGPRLGNVSPKHRRGRALYALGTKTSNCLDPGLRSPHAGRGFAQQLAGSGSRAGLGLARLRERESAAMFRVVTVGR